MPYRLGEMSAWPEASEKPQICIAVIAAGVAHGIVVREKSPL